MELQQGRSIIGIDTSLKEVYSLLRKAAPTNGTVLVTGESGTGKEVFVRTLHERSLRKNKPFVPINCGAIPKELLEATLFGHEKGAYTSAHRSNAGKFELADGGTIFLDEIGDMSLDLQVKVLRVLQEREIERVGGSVTQKIDVRIVAATNKDLAKEVEAGRFREDLYYRINVISVYLPPLRERKEDIIPLCEHFLERYCKENSRETPKLSKECQEYLLSYSWHGNIREVQNVMQFMSILSEGDVITIKDVPSKIRKEIEEKVTNTYMPKIAEQECVLEEQNSTAYLKQEDMARATMPSFSFEQWPSLTDLHNNNMGLKEFLDTIETRLLQEALERTEGVKNQAAEILGIKRTTLIEKLKKRGQIL